MQLVAAVHDEGDVLILCVWLTRFWLHLFLSSFSWFGRNWCNCYLQSVMWSFLCILLDMSTGIIKSLRNFLNFEVSISRNACDYMFQGRLCGSMMFLPICYIDKYFSAISICNLMEWQQSMLVSILWSILVNSRQDISVKRNQVWIILWWWVWGQGILWWFATWQS
jgi:hypothetical protein